MCSFVLFLLICIGAVQPICQSSWPFTNSGQGYRWKTCQTTALEIAQQFVEVDKKIQTFCNSYANHVMKEVYGMEHYRLSVSLPDFSEDHIVVKVMHRLVLVRAEDCARTYADVKLLPEVVDPKRAVWKYSVGELVVLFPYKMMPTVSVQKTCGGFIDESVLIVGKQTCGDCDAPDIDVRFGVTVSVSGAGKVRDTVWHSASQSGYVHNNVFKK